MTRQYAVEISLARPASDRELHQARHRVRFAVNADRTRLMTVQSGKGPGSALHRLRRQLDAVLPVDVLTTHYPDRQGHILLNVALSRRAGTEIRRAATASGRRPRDVLGERISTSLAQEQRERRHRLDAQLQHLLTHHTPEEVLTCMASRLLRGRPPG
ncbi:hypothetical protein [Streptomyces sp. NBC_00038]|uniref:hypothetical protein n=1 Tax=Streptomyces sp. NBC_00038 TaxID=2903615 RepID=UPI0022515182|nr:hypothetical protein [Streptomyces sp. NBC_00038]MCX5559501.1 hypothetical protein [Streptomyces sp. NBC_00038]